MDEMKKTAGGTQFRVGIDIGGTFTDLYLVQEDKITAKLKILTTPHDPSEAFLQGLYELIREQSLSMEDCKVIIHGTTLVTNTIIERKGARTALITTEGFRDILEMRREVRYKTYDLDIEIPQPLVPRNLRWGILERISADGSILTPLDASQAEKLPEMLSRQKIDAVAICFLHAYRNPVHEQKMLEIIRKNNPKISISLSSEVVPAIREYERTSTTVANAYVQPLAASYIQRLEDHLSDAGFRGKLFFMMSNGGIMTPETACEYPVRMLESGPAAGALGAANFSRWTKENRVMSFDIGGTTAKTSLIDDGEPLIAAEFEAARVGRFHKGSGLPIQIPAIELIEIGAGGGSIARVDELGLLKVGPESAGADPGPTCYGRGGTDPTVTDADLILGYLNSDYFLGGKMPLDATAAAEAITRKVATPLGIDLLSAAWGIHEIVCENMAIASRIHILERGRDPRRYVMLAMGGAGPVHAIRVAQKLGCDRVLFPAAAGVFSAIGLLVAPLSFDYIHTRYMVLDDVDTDLISLLFQEMEEDGYGKLRALGIPRTNVMIQRSADMQYRGQGHQIKVLLSNGKISDNWVQDARKAYNKAYRAVYNRILEDIPVEVVNWRCVVSAPVEKIPMETVGGDSLEKALKGHRPVFFPGNKDKILSPVYERYDLPPDTRLEGPAVVEEKESTAVIHPGDLFEIDEGGSLIVHVKPSGSRK